MFECILRLNMKEFVSHLTLFILELKLDFQNFLHLCLN